MTNPTTPDADSQVSREAAAPFVIGQLAAHDIAALLELGNEHGPPGEPWPAPPVSEIQKALPGYEVLELCGRGGMGAVYRAVHLALQRTVAIKVLPPFVGETEPGFTERFKREARTVAQLKHPGIVNVHDAGEAPGGLLYLVMEFVDGTDLGQILAGESSPGAERTLACGIQVCDALAFAHASGVVHRDIKPANILLDQQGRIKVSDFGLAKSAAETSPPITRQMVALGTPDFAAPETRAKGGKADHRADLYSLGVTLYLMLTGKLPHGDWEPPSALAATRPSLDRVLRKALASDPARRYSSAQELKKALEAEQRALLHPSMPRFLWVLGSVFVCALVAWLSWPPPEQGDPYLPGQACTDLLGRPHLPLPGKPHVLMCQWETRVSDFAEFVRSTGHESRARLNWNINGPAPAGSWSWRNPGFDQKPDHPVVAVDLRDANAFCRWMTQRERKAGHLLPGQEVRLPTDHEWSLALGVQDEPALLPVLQQAPERAYPWGSIWPPPQGLENGPAELACDTFAATCPVNAGSAGRLGFFQLWGNVRELTKDRASLNDTAINSRGADFDWADAAVRSAHRSSQDRFMGTPRVGFRCVIDLKSSPAKRELAQRLEHGAMTFIAQMEAKDSTKDDAADWLVDDDHVCLDLVRGGSLRVEELAGFAGLPVDTLHAGVESMAVLAAVDAMPLRVLSVRVRTGASIEEVRKFKDLRCLGLSFGTQSNLADLSPLAGLALQALSCTGSVKVADVTPLKDMPLQQLELTQCQVRDLSPLSQAPLRKLNIDGIPLNDLSILSSWQNLAECQGIERQLCREAVDAALTGDEKTALQKWQETLKKWEAAAWFNPYRGKLLTLRQKLLLLAGWARGEGGDIPSETLLYDGHAYFHIDLPMDFSQAQQAAAKLHSHLVTLESKGEMDCISEWFVSKRKLTPWLGLAGSEAKAEWTWLNGRPAKPGRWGGDGNGGPPLGADRRRAFLTTGDGGASVWRQVREDSLRTVLIEWDGGVPAALVSTPAKPSQELTPAVHRAIAEKVLMLGGRVAVEEPDGRRVWYNTLNEPPPGDWEVVTISLDLPGRSRVPLSRDELLFLLQPANLDSVVLYGVSPEIDAQVMRRLGEMRGLRWLGISNVKIEDEWLRGLGNCELLESFCLPGCGIGDAGLEHLKHQRHLTNVDVQRTSVTGAAISRMASAATLQYVVLGNKGRQMDADIEALLPACTGLLSLKVFGDVRGPPLNGLPALKSLRVLGFGDTALSTEVLDQLIKASCPPALALTNCTLDPEGWHRLPDLEHVITLRYIGDQWPDDATRALRRMSNLQQLELFDRTRDLASKVRAEVPRVTVVTN